MSRLGDVLERFRTWRDRDHVEREMDEELRFHVDMATERYIVRGMSPSEARRLALRDFGGVERHKEEVRDSRPTQWLDHAWQDLRFVGRTMRKSPGFATAVILTLALGMGAVTAIFSVVNGVLLRPLPYPHPDQLVYLGWDFGGGKVNRNLTAYQLDFVRRHSKSVEGVATYRTFDREIGDPTLFQLAHGLLVSEDFFRVTAMPPVRGRAFTEQESRPGGDPVVILSDATWHREFNGDPSAIGRELRLGGTSYTVIGVMPPEFRFAVAPENTELFLPLRLEPNPRDEGHNYDAFARLREGWSRDAAERELTHVVGLLREEHPEHFEAADEGFRVLGFEDLYVGDLSRTLWVLLGAVGCVLLIACANAANLLLARAVSREREIIVRSALGAARGRILRQLLIEGLALAFVAGVIGTLLGSWSLRTMLALAPRALPRAQEIGLDRRVVVFTLGVIAVTGVLFGLIAALPTSRLNLAASLRERSLGGSARARLRELLVVGETAFAIVLLAGAGLLIASFGKLSGVDPGFSAESVVAVQFGRMPAGYDDARRLTFERELLRRVRETAGVESAGGVSTLPLSGFNNIPMAVEGHPDLAEGDVEWRMATPGYFETLKIPLRRGRAFAEADGKGAARVAIVNETFARRFFPNQDPIGQRIEIGKWKGEWLAPMFAPAVEIIGVTADLRDLGLDRAPKRMVFVPVEQWPGMADQIRFVVRTSTPSLVRGQVESITRAVDPAVPPPVIEELTAIVGASIRGQRFQMVLLTVFAGSALLLTAIGIFAVLSYSVRERSREIGVRVALGARPGTVMRLVVGRGMMLVGAGATIGVVGALLLTRTLTAMLYDVTPTDPIVLVSAVTLLLGIALIAAWIPARRAALVDPLVALRSD